MKATATVKTWEKTKLQNMVRHKSGRYYARLFRDSKEIWKSLKTSLYSVAEARLAELLKEHRQNRTKKVDAASANMTFGQAAELHMAQIERKVGIKRRTKAYWRETLDAMYRSWPELPGKVIRRFTTAECSAWAADYSETACSTRYNNSVSLFRHVIAVAIENGIVLANIGDKLERKPVKAKILELPSLEQFSQLVGEIRTAPNRYGKDCADFTEGLAFTGCRLSEARRIEIGDLDFVRGEVLVKGDPEEATKNGEIRRVPMIPGARALFERMISERPDDPKTAPLFRVRECQKSVDRAAKKIGMERITHHDLRHFFATVCIESGVDIPTVSRWLGHKDGGVLAMKTYGHLRREHSVSQAQKVSFTPTAAAAA